MATSAPPLTLDAFLQLPEQKPALEYGPGGAISQKPMGTTDHSTVQANVLQWLKATGLGRAYPELRVVLGGLSRVPDVAFYRRERLPREQRPTSPPDVCVEVLSPDQAIGDQQEKCRWYVRQGVGLTLLADPERRVVLSYTAQTEGRITASGSVEVLGQTLTMAELFQDVLGA